MSKWPALLKAVAFSTNKEVRHTSGHLSEPTSTNGTVQFRQSARRKKWERIKQMKLTVVKENRLSLSWRLHLWPGSNLSWSWFILCENREEKKRRNVEGVCDRNAPDLVAAVCVFATVWRLPRLPHRRGLWTQVSSHSYTSITFPITSQSC